MSKHEDEDEFDDLDDLLDDFAEEVLSKPPGSALDAPPQTASISGGTTISSTRPTLETAEQHVEATTTTPSGTTKKVSIDASATRSVPAGSNPDTSIPELDEEFAKKLKLGVDYLLDDLNENPEAKSEFEALMDSMAKATNAGSAAGKTSSQAAAAATAPATGEQSKAGFQDTIAQTMNRLKESNEEMNNAPLSEDDDFMAKMLKELESMGGAGAGSDMDMAGLLSEMLQELSSKEILYDPLKELQEKYPEYLEKNAKKLSEEELARYKNQERLVNEMVSKFEDPNYSEDDDEARKYISVRMEEMQNSGSPPQELMGDLTQGAIPGFGAGMDGMPSMPDMGDMNDCNVQ